MLRFMCDVGVYNCRNSPQWMETEIEVSLGRDIKAAVAQTSETENKKHVGKFNCYLKSRISWQPY